MWQIVLSQTRNRQAATLHIKTLAVLQGAPVFNQAMNLPTIHGLDLH